MLLYNVHTAGTTSHFPKVLAMKRNPVMKLEIKFFPFHWQALQYFNLIKKDPMCRKGNALHTNVFNLFCCGPYIEDSTFFWSEIISF